MIMKTEELGIPNSCYGASVKPLRSQPRNRRGTRQKSPDGQA